MTNTAQLAWAALRIVAGGLLAYLHGRPKVLGGGMERFIHSVSELGFPAPAFFAWSAALSELVGGTLVALGLATRPSAALAGFTMAVAIYQHRLDPLSKMELPLLFLAVFVFAVVAGGGRYSLDAFLRVRMPIAWRSL